MPFLQKNLSHLTFSSHRSTIYKVPPHIGGHHFLLCRQTNTKDIAGQPANLCAASFVSKNGLKYHMEHGVHSQNSATRFHNFASSCIWDSMELAVQDSNVSFGSVIDSNLFSLSIYEIKKCILFLQAEHFVSLSSSNNLHTVHHRHRFLLSAN